MDVLGANRPQRVVCSKRCCGSITKCVWCSRCRSLLNEVNLGREEVEIL